MIEASLDPSLSFLVNLFNETLVSRNYPENWSKSIIIPMPKLDEDGNPDKYFGIKTNSCLIKCFELHLNNRLSNL